MARSQKGAGMAIDRCFNVMDFRGQARRALPAPLFHYIDGGADDEWTLRNNTTAFDGYELWPTQLRDVTTIDTRTRVLGADLSMPLFCSPTGMSRLFHHAKEPAVARAAAKAGVMYSLSTIGTTTIEDVAAAGDGPKMFQVYILKDRELTKELIARCKAAGFTAICLTVDTPVAGNRERDHRTGMVMPPKLTLASLASFTAHPVWGLHYLRDSNFDIANVAHRVDALGGGAMGLIEYVNSQFDRSVSWDDAAWLIEEWGGPFAFKGLQAPGDAKRAVEVGASAIMISNHGGRQLESAPAPVDCVAPIRDAVGDALELIVDGGVRRGNHVVKALALGANACSVGRPYLYALAAGGEAGVTRVLDIFRAEIERTLALLGCASLADLRPEHVRTR